MKLITGLHINVLNMIAQCIKKVLFIVITLLVTGCVSALPMKHEYKSREIFPLPFDQVWTLSSNFLEKNVSPVKIADKKSGLLESREFKVPYYGFQYASEYTDCGKLGSLYVYHEIIGHYEIFISELDENRTSVRIIPDYRASLWLGKSFKGWVNCRSRGYVEQSFVDNLWAQIQKPYSKEGLGPLQEYDMIKEPGEISADHVLESQDSNNKGAGEPGTGLTPETELKNIMVKYENAIQEIDKLSNELTALKSGNKCENNNIYAGEAELSDADTASDKTRTYDNDDTAQSVPEKANKKSTIASRPLRQKTEDIPEIYTVQTGSFLDINRAMEQFNFIADHLHSKNYSNLRIEKIGKYYAVRLGKYNNDSSAERMLRKLIHDIKSPVVLKAYIKEDRIIKP
ncbi:MAG: SPOR domain-containing protein [Nitrospiraceae bacterium]|nr:MAG: SPOR domain-containing protein [Nitrospiraceae bacterium]